MLNEATIIATAAVVTNFYVKYMGRVTKNNVKTVGMVLT